MPKSRAAFSRLPHLCGTIGQSELRARFGTVCTDSDTAWAVELVDLHTAEFPDSVIHMTGFLPVSGYFCPELIIP